MSEVRSWGREVEVRASGDPARADHNEVLKADSAGRREQTEPVQNALMPTHRCKFKSPEPVTDRVHGRECASPDIPSIIFLTCPNRSLALSCVTCQLDFLRKPAGIPLRGPDLTNTLQRVSPLKPSPVQIMSLSATPAQSES